MKKRGYFAGWHTVFGFTLGRQIRNKTYIILTTVIAILLFAGIFTGIFAANSSYVKKASLTDSTLERVIIYDETGDFANNSWLVMPEAPLFADTEYLSEDSAADALAGSGLNDLVLVISEYEGKYNLDIITPDNTALSNTEISEYVNYVSTAFRAELIRNSGIDPASLSWLATPVTSNILSTDDIGSSTADEMRKNINMAVSYVTIFLMYMLTIFYGQGAASAVILEKTSKLMDFFLVTVKPAAMIFGKVMAAAMAAFLQIALWLAAAIAGLKISLAALPSVFGAVSPDISDIMNMFSGIGGMLSPGGIVIALLMIAVGFLLYCSLAAVGGSMASKPEDLSSTNTIFALSVVASFLLSISSGSSGGMVSTEKWLIYFPFTAIMVTPGRAMTGTISLTDGIISVILVALLAFAGIIIAGKVYEMMSFYRGNPPTPAKIFNMLRDRKKN